MRAFFINSVLTGLEKVELIDGCHGSMMSVLPHKTFNLFNSTHSYDVPGKDTYPTG